MAEHPHSVYDTDKHFQINPATRELINLTPEKVALMQYDHGSERITFELPRKIEEHDMTLCNRVTIHGTNTDAQTKAFVTSRYEVEDLGISPADQEVCICSWLVKDGFTSLAGPLSFRVTFECVDEATGEVTYRWSTALYSGLSISPGIDADREAETAYPDHIRELERRVDALEENGGGGLSEDAVRVIVQEELETIPFAEGEGF